jgi:hypothetical protein
MPIGILDRKGPISTFALTAENRSVNPKSPVWVIIRACEASMEAWEPERRLRLPLLREA